MLRSVSVFSKIAIAAAIGMFLAVETCQAQVRAFVGGGGGRGHGGGGTRWGVSIGSPHYGGYGGYGYGYGGLGYAPYGYGYSPYAYSSPYIYDSSPYVYNTAPMYYGDASMGYMPANTSYQSFYPQNSGANQSDNSASIQVIVPPNAQLWFDGTKTQQTGSTRFFTTPPLTNTQNATYEVRATWTDQSGNTVNRTRRVQVTPNQQAVVNFMQPDQQDNNFNNSANPNTNNLNTTNPNSNNQSGTNPNFNNLNNNNSNSTNPGINNQNGTNPNGKNLNNETGK